MQQPEPVPEEHEALGMHFSFGKTSQERLSLGSSCPYQHERGRSAWDWHSLP